MAELLLAALLSSFPCLEHIVCPHAQAVKHHGHKHELVIDEDTMITLDGAKITVDEFTDLDKGTVEIIRQRVHRSHVEWLELETKEDDTEEIDWA